MIGRDVRQGNAQKPYQREGSRNIDWQRLAEMNDPRINLPTAFKNRCRAEVEDNQVSQLDFNCPRPTQLRAVPANHATLRPPFNAPDRMALGRCRPEAPTDLYLLALEHAVSQIMVSLL